MKVNVTYPETASDRMATALDEQREVDQALEEYTKAKIINEATTLELIQELYRRGTTIKDIYGRFYEFEVASDGRSIDIEDAALAGVL